MMCCRCVLGSLTAPMTPWEELAGNPGGPLCLGSSVYMPAVEKRHLSREGEFLQISSAGPSFRRRTTLFL